MSIEGEKDNNVLGSPAVKRYYATQIEKLTQQSVYIRALARLYYYFKNNHAI